MANASISFTGTSSNVSDFLGNVSTMPKSTPGAPSESALPLLDPEQTAKQVLEFLNIRELTVDEIAQGLVPLKIDPAEISKAIELLTSTDMIESVQGQDGVRLKLTPFAKDALSHFAVR